MAEPGQKKAYAIDAEIRNDGRAWEEFRDRISSRAKERQQERDAEKVRLSGDAREAVMPHDGKIDGIVGEKTVGFFNVVAVADVRGFERKDLNADSLNGLMRREMPEKLLDVRRVVLKVTDSRLGLDLKRPDSFDNHQAMKSFSQNQCGCETGELGIFDTLEKVGAAIGELSGAGEMVNENVGINEDVRAVRKVYRHGGV